MTRPRGLRIREFVSSESFEDSTERGIRLSDCTQVELFRDILSEVLRDLLIYGNIADREGW